MKKMFGKFAVILAFAFPKIKQKMSSATNCALKNIDTANNAMS